TNGQLLARKLPILLDAGIRRINVSLDTLDPAAFRVIARGGDLNTVLEGMEQARAAGIRIKVNMVPLRGQNLDQVMPLLDYCLTRGYELRFIELMRMGHLAGDQNAFLQQFVSLAQLLSLIGEHYEYLQADAPVDATAVRYRIPDKGYFGVIANESVPFCRTASGLPRAGAKAALPGHSPVFRRRTLEEVMRSLVLLLTSLALSGCMHVSDLAQGAHDELSDAGLLDHSSTRRINNFRLQPDSFIYIAQGAFAPPGGAYPRPNVVAEEAFNGFIEYFPMVRRARAPEGLDDAMNEARAAGAHYLLYTRFAKADDRIGNFDEWSDQEAVDRLGVDSGVI
nr:hypothetical protein [Tanacetum cinerariifolium]